MLSCASLKILDCLSAPSLAYLGIAIEIPVDFLFDTLPLTEDEGQRELERTVNGVTRNTEALGLVGLVVLLYRPAH